MPSNDALIKEIRENYDYAAAYWAENRKLGEEDIRCLVEGPWTAEELEDRKGRVTLTLDELGQYVNQICNEFRQNKRSVKVNPRGEGASDDTARMRAAMIREIEYQCKAQQAYVSAGEDMVQRWVGYVKLATEYEPGSSRRRMKIVRIPNPDVIYLDPDFKEPDASDCNWGFEIEVFREKAFIARFGKQATITDFSDIGRDGSAGWVTAGDNGKQIRVASYWKRIAKPNPIYLLENGRDVNVAQFEGLQVLKRDKETFLVLDGTPYRVVDEHEDNDYTVTQYVTNGLEVIEENPSDWKEIPLIPFFAREMWVTKGGQARRIYKSAIRMARDAYKSYCYVQSAKVERLAMDPKTPYEGYEGQFDTQTDFATVNKNLQGYVEFKPKTTATGDVILPLPRRNLTEPQVNQYEVAAESFRRAIQAAMGGSPLPTSAQRQNEKSGIALARIEQSADQGNFHFIDNYDRALERAGRMMDESLEVVYDTPREHGFRSESDEYSVEKINQTDEAGNPVGFHTATGDHGVTISTGPSYQSQRDEATDFTNQLIAHPEVLGPNAPKIIALLVKLRDLGPIGDQIAQILDPPQNDIPPELGAQIQGAQQTIQQLQAENEALKAGDAIKRYCTDEQEKTKRVLGLIKVDQQDAEVQLEKMLGMISEKFQKLHDMHAKLMDQQHEREMAAAGQEHEAAMAASGQQHQAAMAEQQAAQEQAAQQAAAEQEQSAQEQATVA